MSKGWLKWSVGMVILALTFGVALSAAQKEEAAKVAGKWEMTSPGRQGNVTREMVIEQTGDKIKGTLKDQRGESPFEGTVKGNKISFTVKRQRPDGGEFTIEYTGTVEGDSIKGTIEMGGGPGGGPGGPGKGPGGGGPREWTAKRMK